VVQPILIGLSQGAGPQLRAWPTRCTPKPVPVKTSTSFHAEAAAVARQVRKPGWTCWPRTCRVGASQAPDVLREQMRRCDAQALAPHGRRRRARTPKSIAGATSAAVLRRILNRGNR
jgi:hypothetical protein